MSHQPSFVAHSKKKVKVAILTRRDHRSPRILGESLGSQLQRAGIDVEIHFEIGALSRLVSWGMRRRTTRFHFWLRQKLTHLAADWLLFHHLKASDAIVISECIPNGFLTDHYNVERFRKIVRKPVLFYEVFYLGNAPSQIRKLEARGQPQLERYDWHLAVAAATESLESTAGPWTCIGLDLSYLNLRPRKRNRFLALVDFQQPGHEALREDHLRILDELGVETIALERSYTISEMRDLYGQAAIFFLETPEAFGLPIAECLALGTRIYLPEPAWAMSWRLPEGRSGKAGLPDCFVVYESREDLKKKIATEREFYDPKETPDRIFQSFLSNYRNFYYGNPEGIAEVAARIQASASRGEV